MRTTRYLVGLLLALALLVGLRLPLLRCEAFVPGAPLLFDEKDYLHGARSFAAGDRSSDTAEAWLRAPATSWLLLTLGRLRGVPPELAGCDFQRAQIAMWAVLLLLVASIAACLFDRGVALASAFLVALLPVGVSVTLMLHADTLFCVGMVGAVWALLQYARRRRLIWLVLAGLSAGGGILTRSPLLPMLPLLALWVALESWRGAAGQPPLPGRLARALLPPLLFLGVVALVIAPWTWRNYQLYGGFIPSDTTGAITLYHNNASGQNVSFDSIRAAAPDPVGRQRYAMRRAWEVISADPARFARKFVYSSLIGWSPENFLHTRSFFAALLERPLLASIFAQLTVLMWLEIPLLLLGLLFAPRERPGAWGYHLLMIALALLYTAMIGATHFEERYRMPFLLLWLPYAGWCLAQPRALFARLRRPIGLLAVGAMVAVALLYLPLLWPAQWDDARALALYGRGQLRTQMGDLAGALADQQAAAALQPELREARVAAAQLQARMGDRAGAEQSLRAALGDAAALKLRPPADATVALQQLLRVEGRSAESDALDTTLDPPMRRRAEQLAWQQGAAPGSDLRLGGDDLGLLRGFYSSGEAQDFRWSGPQAQILLAGRGQYACLRASAARPPELPAPLLRLSARLNGGAPIELGQLRPPRHGWAWLCAPLPDAQSGMVELDLQTSSYNPFAAGLSKDARDLGLAVAEAALRDGPLAIDPASGLLLDHQAPGGEPGQALQLLGLNGPLRGKPGAQVPLTLWWRAAQAPPNGVFTFLHLLDSAGNKVAEYNAPLAGGRRPQPWAAAEPLIDPAALALPAGLAPGRYQLIGGAFDPGSGMRLAEAALGELVVE